MIATNSVISIALILVMSLALGGGLYGRIKANLGIGWQFIRYCVLTMSIPAIALLALNDALTSEAATLMAGTLGYAFGQRDESSRTDKKKPASPSSDKQ